VIEKIVQLGPGFLSSSRAPCPDCRGEGMTYAKEDKCKKCDGNCILDEKKTLEVVVEPGIPDAHLVQFHGDGDEVPGALAGDLYVKLIIEKHDVFERKGADLHMKKTISLYEALTGTVFQIEFLDGSKINVTSAPGEVISPGTKKQLLKKGMPFFKDAMGRGNLYIEFDIEFPKKSELKGLDSLKNILPVPKTQTSAGSGKMIVMEDYNEDSKNSHAEGGKGKAHDEEWEDEDGHHHHRGHGGGGQRVECNQQ